VFTSTTTTNTKRLTLKRPLVFFFGLAYALAWGALGVLHLIARQSGIESGLALLQMGEAFQFGDTLARYVYGKEAQFEPGQQWRYSNTNVPFRHGNP